jgi:uncharacterized membrane protein YfcA
MRNLWNRHPNLISWAVLAIGMVIIVVLSARSVGFQPTQWAAIIVATVILAGLCVWIVSWEESPVAQAEAGFEGGAVGGGSAARDPLVIKEQDAAAGEIARSEDV